MIKPLHIDQKTARRFLLIHQGLFPARSLKGKNGILQLLSKVGCIQFDPLDIMGKNAELVLQSRILDFTPRLLEELLYKDRALVDGWDKMMSIYPVHDWPSFYPTRERNRAYYSDPSRSANSIIPAVREALEERGPLSSLDLDFNKQIDWSWAPTRIARAALESMYFWGELVVHHKVHTRKVYDFAKNHIAPELLSAPNPHSSEKAFQTWHVYRRLGGVGLLPAQSRDAWLQIHGVKSRERREIIRGLTELRKVQEISIDGIPTPYFIRSSDLPVLETVQNAGMAKASIIAPLDNLLWDRKMIKALFNFDYVWEVYKPQEKRRFGYYVLPVLYGDRFIARFEPGRNKESGTMLIKNWWWEQDVKSSAGMQRAIKSCFTRFRRLFGAKGIECPPDIEDRIGIDFSS